jgi:hypothetical protein
MQQMAETNTTRGDLTQYLIVMHDELTDLWRRVEAATRADENTA